MDSTSPLMDVTAVQKLDLVPTILSVVSRITGMGFCAVARPAEDRWIACSVKDNVGLGITAGQDLNIKTSLRDELRRNAERVIFELASCDEHYCRHQRLQIPELQSYISIPIFRANDEFFGVLCAIGSAPVSIDITETTNMLGLLASIIGSHLDPTDRVAAAEEALAQERKIGTLREQFISVLGHDLRNPLASIDANAQLIRRRTGEPDLLPLLTRIDRSVKRMNGLIANLIDFAHGRLGGGLTLSICSNVPLTSALIDVVDELRAVWPEREIRGEIDDLGLVACDPARLAQLLSNLLANALAHGGDDEPIIVTGSRIGNEIHLSVENGGGPIPEAVVTHLFQPFHRTGGTATTEGLGLGLFIVSEIAKAHGGNIAVISHASRVRFTFTMVDRAAPA